MKTKLPLVLLSALALPALGAGTWTTSSWDGGFVPSAKNILRAKAPDNPAAAANALVRADNGSLIAEGSCSYATLTDGNAGIKDKSGTTCLPSNCSLSYDLGSARTINEVRIYSTWSDGGRDTLSVASVTAETQNGQTVTLSPGSVSHSGNNNCACATLKMADDSPLCENAVKVTFNFGAQENGYVGYAELEVIVDGAVDLDLSGIIEITAGNDVTTNRTPDDLSIYGPNGGNLTIAGSGVVVTQNVPDVKTMAGVNFGNYWPWLDGTVTVENGARLESDTMLFWGSGQGTTYKDNTRKLLVRSGGTAVFSPPGGVLHIIGVQNSGYQGAWLVVTGANSKAVLPATVWLSNNAGDPGHGGGLDVLDGGTVELGTLNAGHSGGTLRLNIDGGTLRSTGGIYCYRNYNRWTGGSFTFRDCLVETPVFKFTYPASSYCGDTVTFDGAVFRPLGTPAAKFFDGPPAIADKNAKFVVAGNGLIIDAPAGSTLEASALLQGEGGFTKRGAGTVVLSAANVYTGTTTVEAGTLDVTGSFAGPLAVSGGAAVFSGAPTLPGLSIASGASVTVTGVGADVGAVSDCAGDFVVAGVSEWPRNTPLVSSSTDAFLAKVAASLNAGETIPAGMEFIVKEGSVQLVEAGIVNGTLVWTGTAGDTLWSTAGNWGDAGRRIYSGDALVVAAGGASTVDLGEEVVLVSARFGEGIGAHTVSPAGASDSLKINALVTNESASAQTFAIPVSIGEAAFTVYTAGDTVFSNGLAAAAGVAPTVVKTGAGELAVDGATWGGGLDLRGGSVALSGQTAGAQVLSSAAGAVRIDGLFDAGGAAVTLAESTPRILGGNAVLANGIFTYVPRPGYAYLDLDESQVLTLTNGASLATTSAIFENGTGSARGIRILDDSSLIFNNSGNAYISSKDNGIGNFLYASGGSTIVLPRGRTYIAWPSWGGRNGRIDVSDGSFVSGGSVEFGWRASESWFTLTNSAASFTDGLYLDVAANIDYAHSHMHVSGSVVTAGVWRVGNSAGKVHSETNPAKCTELVFDDATLVAYKDDTDAEPWFKCTKPDCDQIRILAGGLAVDTTNTVTLAAPLVGAGGLTKLGSGTLTVASTNSYAGATVVSNGTLRLTGRVAGALAVAPGATLALPIPAAGEAVPTVPSLVVEEGGALAAIVPGLPQGVACVDVLYTTGELSIPVQTGDAAHKRFFVGPSRGGQALRYGNPPCTVIIVR